MGFADDMEDYRWEREQAERLSKPSTHFTDAHGGKNGVFLRDDGTTLEGKIGMPSGYDTILFHYTDKESSEWRNFPARMHAIIDRVFVDEGIDADLTDALNGNIENLNAKIAREQAAAITNTPTETVQETEVEEPAARF